MADDIEALAKVKWALDHYGPADAEPFQFSRYESPAHAALAAVLAAGYVSPARHDARIAEVVATWQATLDKTVDEANRQLAEAKAAGAAEVVARGLALADEWDGGEPNGVSHAVACKSYNCPDCAVIACAADLRTALTTGGEERE